MNDITLHVEEKKNLRISTTKRNNYLYIRGYLCTKQCPDCQLHKVGEDLERLNQNCKKLSKKDLRVEMKIKFNVSEKITFI